MMTEPNTLNTVTTCNYCARERAYCFLTEHGAFCSGLCEQGELVRRGMLQEIEADTMLAGKDGK